MKKLLHFAFSFSLLGIGFKTHAQGLTCATALPVTPGTFTASTLIGTPSQTTATAAGWYLQPYFSVTSLSALVEDRLLTVSPFLLLKT